MTAILPKHFDPKALHWISNPRFLSGHLLRQVLQVDLVVGAVQLLAAAVEQNEVVTLAKSNKVSPAPVTSSYSEYASLLSTCEILLTPDTSVVHLCAALWTPIVAYYHVSPPTLHYWTPVGVPYQMLIHEPLQEIDPHEVAASFDQLYNKTTANKLEEEVTV